MTDLVHFHKKFESFLKECIYSREKVLKIKQPIGKFETQITQNFKLGVPRLSSGCFWSGPGVVQLQLQFKVSQRCFD